MSTVPMFAPDGTLGDIPFDKLMAAKQAGFTPGVTMKSADGQTGIIPANRVPDAVKSGKMQIVPHEEQDAQHPGFWHNLYSDLAGMAEAAPQMLRLMEPAGPRLYGTGATGGGAEIAQQQMEQTGQNYQQRKAAGNTLPYRVGAAAAENLGANVKGMEESATEGDVGGVLGHAAAVPTVMAATEGLTRGAPVAGDLAARAVKSAKPTLRATGASLTAVGETLNPDLVGIISPRAAHALRLARQGGKIATTLGEEKPVYPGAKFPEGDLTQFPGAHLPEGDLTTFPGATFPEVPPPQVLQANTLSQKPISTVAPPEQAAALGRVGTRTSATLTPASTEPMPSGEGLPRTLQGDSALRKILTGQDNTNLMKIAKSRGINVARESQLKPGAADNLLINKIIDDFKPEELDEIRDRYLESTRFKHDFGDIGPDAWKTISLQTYFPDLKLPKTAIAKTHASILKAAGSRIEKTAPAADEDLTGILQQSLAAVKARP